MLIRNAHVEATPKSSDRGVVFGGLMADMAKYGCVFAPEDGTGSQSAEDAPDEDEDDKPEGAQPKKAEEESSKKARRTKAEIDAERLATELEEARALLKNFEGATPDEIKELREVKKKADEAAKKAAKEKKEAETRRLQEAGDFEGLKAQMAAEHQAETERMSSMISELQGVSQGLQSQLSGVQLQAQFFGSKYVSDETILTPSKAMKLFSDHFEVTDDGVQGYDQPAGSTKRVPLVDSRGRPLGFDEAMKRIIEADPDAERLIRSKMKPGSGQTPVKGKVETQPRQLSGLERIAAGLANLNKK